MPHSTLIPTSEWSIRYNGDARDAACEALKCVVPLTRDGRTCLRMGMPRAWLSECDTCRRAQVLSGVTPRPSPLTPLCIDGTESVPDCFKHLSSDTDKSDSFYCSYVFIPGERF